VDSIAATQETARRSTWFLTERTNVDDAIAGADSLEKLQKVSREEIAVCGGSTFKETMMSRDPVADLANAKKVLEVIWDTAADKLQMDMKVNFRDKQKGTRVDPNVDRMEEVDTFTHAVVLTYTSGSRSSLSPC
jgi:hypothetical protein